MVLNEYRKRLLGPQAVSLHREAQLFCAFSYADKITIRKYDFVKNDWKENNTVSLLLYPFCNLRKSN